MSTEIIVALIAAGGIILAGGVGMATAYLTARHTTKTHTEAAETEFLKARDQLLWDKAGEFWDQRAADLSNQVALERTAREAAVANLTAELAVVKQGNAELQRQNLECEKNLKIFEMRLKRAGEQLVATVEAAAEAASAATESTVASEAAEAAVEVVEAAAAEVGEAEDSN